MIPVTTSDMAATMAFFLARPTAAMFPATNLSEFGIAGGHPRAMTFWQHRQGDTVTDVLGITDAGMVMPVFTTAAVPGIAAVLAGRDINSVVGVAGAVAQVQAACNLPRGGLDRVEPHLELDLSKLRVPDISRFTLRPVSHLPREVMIVWRTQYGIDALELAPADAAMQAGPAVDAMIARDSHRVLMDGETPIAMTGFNAILPNHVMIGGVYTPGALRGRGYAKAALAMHLIEARENGVVQAVLSAANVSATKTYTSIGFQQIGTFHIVIYNQPQVIHA